VSESETVRARSPSDPWWVERLVAGGDGFLRAPDGRAAFVPGGLPGDRIRPERVEDRRQHWRVQAWELAEPSPDRIEPLCPVSAACGGCDWMTLARPAQIRWKSEVLRESLRRIGQFPDAEIPAEIPVHAAAAEGWRCRVRFHVDESGRVGFFARGSHELVEVPACLVADPRIDAALATLRDVADKLGGARTFLGAFAEVEARAGDAGAESSAVLLDFLPRSAPSEPARMLLAELSARGLRVAVAGLAPRGFAPLAPQRWLLPGGTGTRLSVPPGAFVQAHPAVNSLLVQAVLDGARAHAATSFLDLYCGCGNFALPLAASGIPGAGVEGEPAAVEAARQAAAEASGAPLAVEFFHAPVATALAELRAGGRSFDLVILDPPRSGAREALPGLLALEPRLVACVSCDPATWARDLRTLREGGWRLISVVGFDMFPHTHHVEGLAWMARPPAQAETGSGKLAG
jgi:23S rRNA (uracil1939-C5)-methyltransferase